MRNKIFHECINIRRLQNVSYIEQNTNENVREPVYFHRFVAANANNLGRSFERSIPRIKSVEARAPTQICCGNFENLAKSRRGYKYQAFHVLLLSVSLGSDWVFLKCRLRNANECKYLIKGCVIFGKCIETMVYLRWKNIALRVLLFINAQV